MHLPRPVLRPVLLRLHSRIPHHLLTHHHPILHNKLHRHLHIRHHRFHLHTHLHHRMYIHRRLRKIHTRLLLHRHLRKIHTHPLLNRHLRKIHTHLLLNRRLHRTRTHPLHPLTLRSLHLQINLRLPPADHLNGEILSLLPYFHAVLPVLFLSLFLLAKTPLPELHLQFHQSAAEYQETGLEYLP